MGNTFQNCYFANGAHFGDFSLVVGGVVLASDVFTSTFANATCDLNTILEGNVNVSPPGALLSAVHVANELGLTVQKGAILSIEMHTAPARLWGIGGINAVDMNSCVENATGDGWDIATAMGPFQLNDNDYGWSFSSTGINAGTFAPQSSITTTTLNTTGGIQNPVTKCAFANATST